MLTYALRVKPSRPSFALDMSPEEQAVMGRHAEHWQPWIEAGKVVVFGPMQADEEGSYGLAVVETDDEDELRAHAAQDPVVTTGTARVDLARMLVGFVRPRA
jgi:uncharacterized protein YciI